MKTTALITFLVSSVLAATAIGWQSFETALMEGQVESVARVCDYAMGKSNHLNFQDTAICGIRAPYARTKAFQRADREIAAGKAQLGCSFAR